MNFRQIELALNLARTLNYRMTAENMFISQPALTHQIKALEEEIGVPLFRRSSHGVSLTAAGALFCREMQRILESAQSTLSAVRNCGGLFEDVLRIGHNDRDAVGVFSDILRRFSDAYPSVLADIRQSHGVGRLNAFLRRDLDVVFYVDEAIPSLTTVERARLFSSRICCVMSRENPLSGRAVVRAADLKGARVFLNDGAGPEALMHAQQALLREVSPVVQLCQSADTALLWIGAGQGVALMPDFCRDGSGRFAWVPYDWEETIPCSVAWHSDDHRPCVAAFVQIAREAFAQR